MLDRNANDEVDELMRGSTQGEIPAAVEERLRRRLSEFRGRVEQRPPNRLWVRGMAMAAVLVAAAVVALVLIPREDGAARVYAAAAERLRGATSIGYTVVLNTAPDVSVDLSFLAPGYRRINCSWGIEIRADGTSGKQLVLFHASRTYLAEEGKQVESVAQQEEFLNRLRSLPQSADELLGEQRAGGKRLLGYRLRKAPDNTGISGVTAFDLWVDAGTREADHVDIAVQEAGKPARQMHIRNIRVDKDVDRALFDLTPPAGYTSMVAAGRAASQAPQAMRVQIAQAGARTAVVAPMTGSYAQAPAALQRVAAFLNTQRVAPAGPPMGRFWDEGHWEAGYPVAAGTQAEAPFEVVTLPTGLAASAVVKGAWGADSGGRWVAFLKSVVEQGYMPAGPAMEMWSGEEGKPAAQFTEMRMAVEKGK